MATPESIAIRRADALGRVAKATRAIAKQTGADIADFPDAHKQDVMRPLVEAEWLAAALEAIAEATVQGEEASPAEDTATSSEQTIDLAATSQDALRAVVTSLEKRAKGR